MSSYLSHRRKGFQGGVTAFDGFGNRSRSFNGVDDYVSIADNADIPTGAQTWCCWIKIDVIEVAIICAHWNSASNQRSFQIYLDGSGKINSTVNGVGVASANRTATSTSTVSTGTWYHVAVIFSPSTSLKIFIDGVEAGQTTSNIPASAKDSTADIGFGAYADSSLHLKGNLADCRIYDTDLTATDISDLYAGTDVQTNLVGHWLTDADNVLDAVGTNHGTNYGSKYSYDNPSPPVEFGSASRSFDGTSDYISLGNSIKFGDGTNDNPFSVSGWIKMDDANKFRILGDWNEISTINSTFVFTTNSSNKLILYLRDASNVAIRAREYNFDMTSYEGEWIHVSATYNGAGGTNADQGIRLYLNGSRVDDATLSTDTYVAMGSTTNNVEIGSIQTNTGRDYSNGKIADVRIYDTDLTASQVLDIYNGTTDRTNLIGQWLTDNDDVEDKAGTNDGTNFGSTYSYDNPPMDLVPSRQASRDFNGTSHYVDLGNDTSLANIFAGGGSISIWIKPDTGGGGGFGRIFEKRLTTPSLIKGWFLLNTNFSGSTYDIRFNVDCASDSRYRIITTNSISSATWQHVCITYNSDLTTNTAEIYINGTPVTYTVESTPVGAIIDDSSVDLLLGETSGTNSRSFDGKMADVRIYDTDLTASQVLAIYNGTTDRTNLIGQWLTNSDDVLDHAGTNDGTNNGSTYSTDSPS